MSAHNLQDMERSTDVEIDRSIEFQKMFLKNKVVEGLAENNFIYPSPIQARAIPLGRCGLDLLIQAKSGTGKTLVFSILALESFNPKIPFPQSLILVPTRELALQVVEVLNKIGNHIPEFIAAAFIGGLDVSEDRKNLQYCSAVVGTPGRILHLIAAKLLNTAQINLLVLDEADNLLKDSFKKDIREIVKTLNKERQTILSSATYYDNVDEQLLSFMNDRYIGVTPKKEPPLLRGIKQFVSVIPDQSDTMEEMKSKIAEMKRIFKMVRFKQCLIFSNYQTRAESYCNHMKNAGWTIEVITGSQAQATRNKTMDSLKKYKCRLLIATDILARGIDVESIDLIINLDVPWDLASYLHRIGRAGRFGSQGISITMATGTKEMNRFKKILNKVGGDEMFVYKLPTEDVGDVWKFHEYEKYEKIYADVDQEEEITKVLTKERRLLENLPQSKEVAVNSIDNEPVVNSGQTNDEDKGDFETSDIKDITNDFQLQLCLNQPEKESHIEIIESNNNINDVSTEPIVAQIEVQNLENLICRPIEESKLSDDEEDLVYHETEENVKDAEPNPTYEVSDNIKIENEEPSQQKENKDNSVSEIKTDIVFQVIPETVDQLISKAMAQFNFSDDDEEDEENVKTQITNEDSSIPDAKYDNVIREGVPFNIELASNHSSQATDAFSEELIAKTIKQLDFVEDEDGVNMRFSVSSTNDDLFIKIMEQKEMAVEKMKLIQPSLDGCSMEVQDDNTSEISKQHNMSEIGSIDTKKSQNFTGRKFDESFSSIKKLRFADDFDLTSNTTGTNMGSDDYMKEEQNSSEEKDVSDVSDYSNDETASSSDSFFEDNQIDEDNEENDEVDIEFEEDLNPETIAYHSIYTNWFNQYWNQLTQIHDYVKFSRYARRNGHQNLGY